MKGLLIITFLFLTTTSFNRFSKEGAQLNKISVDSCFTFNLNTNWKKDKQDPFGGDIYTDYRAKYILNKYTYLRIVVNSIYANKLPEFTEAELEQLKNYWKANRGGKKVIYEPAKIMVINNVKFGILKYHSQIVKKDIVGVIYYFKDIKKRVVEMEFNSEQLALNDVEKKSEAIIRSIQLIAPSLPQK